MLASQLRGGARAASRVSKTGGNRAVTAVTARTAGVRLPVPRGTVCRISSEFKNSKKKEKKSKKMVTVVLDL
jgi:hypothetical protein